MFEVYVGHVLPFLPNFRDDENSIYFYHSNNFNEGQDFDALTCQYPHNGQQCIRNDKVNE